MATRSEDNWLTLSKPPHWEYSQPSPIYCKPSVDSSLTPFILFTPNYLDEEYRNYLYKYDFDQDEYLSFVKFQSGNKRNLCIYHFFRISCHQFFLFYEL